MACPAAESYRQGIDEDLAMKRQTRQARAILEHAAMRTSQSEASTSAGCKLIVLASDPLRKELINKPMIALSSPVASVRW